MQTNDREIILITGSAATGKTAYIQALIDSFRKAGLSFEWHSHHRLNTTDKDFDKKYDKAIQKLLTAYVDVRIMSYRDTDTAWKPLTITTTGIGRARREIAAALAGNAEPLSNKKKLRK